MDELSLLIDLHKEGHRQGPGDDAETMRALSLCNVDDSAPLKVADIGCGTGVSAMILARELNADVTAVDFVKEFLEILNKRAEAAGLAKEIKTLFCSMENLPFSNEDFDILWAEGSIYNIGFENGVRSWRRFLKPGGFLAVSEITWLTRNRPNELQKYWEHEYPEIDTASSKMAVLEQCGYSPVGYFVLPDTCWIDNYFKPLQDRFEAFLKRNRFSHEAQAVVEAQEKEIELYLAYKDFFGYGFYVAQRRD